MTMKKRMESRRAWKWPGQEEVESCLDALYTDGNISRRMEQYYREKRKLLIRVLLAGMFLSVAAWAVSVGNLELTDGFFLPRRNEAYEKDMEFQADEGKNEKVKILVEPKRLSRKESRALLGELQQKMDSLILGENESLEEVRSDLHLLSEIEGTPVTVVWELDSYEVLNLDGSIRPEHLTEEGAIVEYSILMPGVKIGRRARVQYTILGEGTQIGDGANVGTEPDGSADWGVTTCGPRCRIPDGAIIGAGKMLYSDGKGEQQDA